MGLLNALKIKTIEKITASMIAANLVILAVLCYNYYLKF
jgi:hypothetical protein